ncbi:hypothetical protein [Nocardioides rubriscoriae]|uniref:hypothetical protein n=1 Tax=Nocardioides rubriscoriae TaxID=642762 RepID=UPI001478E25B|nr:hypothetical protein [Nocardioides rubriscoriae]
MVGYLGGVLCLVGAILVGARFWGDLGTPWRTAVLGLSAAALLTAGAVVPADDGLGSRLRSVFWLVSLGCLAGLLVVVGDQVLDLGHSSVALLAAGGCALGAAVLWSLHPTPPPQQVAMMVALAVTLATAVDRVSQQPDLPGLGVWVVGVAWALSGWAGLLSPQRMTAVLGSAMAVFGAMLTAGSDAGMLLLTATIVVVVAVAILVHDLALLAVGAVSAVLDLPATMNRWFPDSVAAALLLVIAGLAMVSGAVVIARRGRRTTPDG